MYEDIPAAGYPNLADQKKTSADYNTKLVWLCDEHREHIRCPGDCALSYPQQFYHLGRRRYQSSRSPDYVKHWAAATLTDVCDSKSPIATFANIEVGDGRVSHILFLLMRVDSGLAQLPWG